MHRTRHTYCGLMLQYLYVTCLSDLLLLARIQAGAMCGVSNTAVPDMTGLGGKARTVPSSTSTEASSEAGAEDSSAAVTAESLLNDVS